MMSLALGVALAQAPVVAQVEDAALDQWGA
jgi:hypothetical protein